jgi:hypothetical protein
MADGAGDAVQLHADHSVHLPAPDGGHERVESGAAGPAPGDGMIDELERACAATCGVLAEAVQLGVGVLVAGRDACVDGYAGHGGPLRWLSR